MKSIKNFFNKLTPKRKKLFVLGLIVLISGGLLLLGYQYRDSTPVKTESEKKKKISLDPSLLEKAYSENIRLELEKKDAELNEIKSMMEELKKRVDGSERAETLPKAQHSTSVLGDMNKAVRQETKKDAYVGAEHPSATRQPHTGQQIKYPPPPSLIGPGGQPVLRDEKPQPVGGIETAINVKKDGASAQKDQQKKSTKRTVYLPPSFMDASLLTGFSAATMQSAKSYEKPLLLRVKDLAVLPNEIKTDLKGCFIIASAYGDLSDERAHARLVSLSCLSKNGESVIDASIKGFIVDSDGKIGLAGNVVTKMGALLGRSVLAGFFGGMGEAFEAASTTTYVSNSGTTQTIDPGQIAQAGVGSGLSEGFGELQKFYLEMAKQTFPVVEVGATKTVTVVIEQGVELEIKNYCVGGFDKNCSEEQYLREAPELTRDAQVKPLDAQAKLSKSSKQVPQKSLRQ
ncbi:MAG: TraB/VirB10 family protein [Deltaproteobacteria bacterium]|nr:TraB/VirB10 family protein [Deltaproteobacteria bacterium]